MKKKILFVHHSGILAGAPKSLSYIIRDIDKNIFEPFLLNVEEGPANDFFRTLDVKLYRIKGVRAFHGSTVVSKTILILLRNYIYLLPSIIKAYFFIKKHKPNLIHLNSTCLFAFAIAAKIQKTKVICHVREPIREGYWGAPLRFFCKKFVDGFIAICDNDLTSLKLNPKSKVKREVIYNFVDDIIFEPRNMKLKEELNLKKEDVVFLYLARFSKSNGWKELIEHAKIITQHNNNYHFVLAGTNNPKDLIYNKHSNIHILMFRKNVRDLLIGSDVFICPFTEPHFARGIIEASALGLPIIASNIGGVSELVKNNETGFLYNNFDEFKKATELFGKNKMLRNRFGKKGVEFAFKHFNYKKNLKRTYDFYNTI